MCEALPPTHKKGIHITKVRRHMGRRTEVYITKFQRYMEGRTEVFPVGSRRIVLYLRPICVCPIVMLKRASSRATLVVAVALEQPSSSTHTYYMLKYTISLENRRRKTASQSTRCVCLCRSMFLEASHQTPLASLHVSTQWHDKIFG